MVHFARIPSLLLLSFFTILFSIVAFGIKAQTGEDILNKLSDEDRESLKALVMYPADTREAIFVAAQQPAALIKIKKVQEGTSEAFNEVISTKDKDTQKALWDLTRYPSLIEDLASVGKGNESKAVNALQEHPEIIRVRALQMYDQQFAALGQIAALQKESEAAFEKLMSAYSPMTSEALAKLLEHPEILGIMTESMDVTVTVGDMYRQDPAGTLALAAELNKEVADKNAKELNDWRTRLEEDPEAMAEFEEATEDFMNEHEEDDVYYSEQEAKAEEQKVKEVGTTDQGAQEVHHYYHYSYPYWFGYPRWYYYPRWNPYPWRYDWGWSVGFGGWAIWGMPSFYFMNWYYGYPYHYYNYPGLACHFSDHYYVHRNSLSSVSTTTERWHQDNRDVIQGRLEPGDPGAREAVRELGKLETQRAAYNRNNPDSKLGRREFLASSEEDYRVLAERANKIRPLEEDRVLTGNPSRSVELSPSEARQVSGRSTTKPAGQQDGRKITQPQTVSPSRISGSFQPSRSNLDRAVDQHRSGWNRGIAPTPSSRQGTQTAPRQRAPSRPSGTPSSPSRSSEKKSTGSSGRRK